MKKILKLPTLIAASLMMSALPVHGKQEESRMQKMYQKGTEYAGTTRDALITRIQGSA